MEEIICTICEGDYEFGLGALINSSIKVGFSGKYIICLRDRAPFWKAHIDNQNHLIYSKKGIEIEFIYTDWKDHLSYYKPFLIKSILSDNPSAKIYYFDPDITLIADWKFYSDWSDYGVSLCMDQTFNYLNYQHPWVKQWQEIFEFEIENQTYNLIPYINSGFISIKKADIELINTWLEMTLHLIKIGHNLSSFGVTKQIYNFSRRANPILSDQDLLNASILKNKSVILSIIGQEGMGFISGGFIMLHNTGIKSWRKNFVFLFLKAGQRISLADENYFRNCDYPIKLYTKKVLVLKKINLNITKLLQRIF